MAALGTLNEWAGRVVGCGLCQDIKDLRPENVDNSGGDVQQTSLSGGRPMRRHWCHRDPQEKIAEWGLKPPLQSQVKESSCWT